MGRVVPGPRKIYQNCCKRTCDLILAHRGSLAQPYAGCEICGNLNIISVATCLWLSSPQQTALIQVTVLPVKQKRGSFIQFRGWEACSSDHNPLWRCTHPAYFTISSSLHIITTALLGAAAVVLLSGCLCFILLPGNESCFQWFLFESGLSGPESQEEDQNHRGGIPNLTCAGSWRGESLEDFVQNHLNKGSTAGPRVYQQSEDFEPHVCPSINPTKTTLYAIQCFASKS